MDLIKSGNLYWTHHVREKMRQYRLSESRIKRIIRFPKRLEKGIAPKTVAGMQPAGSKKRPQEIWVMWQTKNKNQRAKNKEKNVLDLKEREMIIISAWRYPGISPVHEPPPIPEEIWELVRKTSNK